MKLPTLEGVYESGENRTASFDLGTSLFTIDEVRIGWVGNIAEGIGHGDGVELPSDYWFEWSADFVAWMDPPGDEYWAAHTGSATLFETEEPFEAFGADTWDFLLDGEGEISVHLAEDIVVGGVMVTPPSGELTDVYLVVDGVPLDAVPTLSEWGIVGMALLLLTAGSIVFGRR